MKNLNLIEISNCFIRWTSGNPSPEPYMASLGYSGLTLCLAYVISVGKCWVYGSMAL